MITYSQFAPTGFDSRGAFLPERQDWLVVPVSQTRDSGPLDQSNFAQALEMLGGESDNVEVHRFGHWGPGWFEIIIIHPSLQKAGEEIEAALENYPVLSDEDYSRREYEAFQESWDSWGRRDYEKALRIKLFTDFAEGVSADWTDEEIDSAFDELTSEQIDSLKDQAAQKVNWECQLDGDGVSINISGLVECTDTDKLADLCIEIAAATFHADEVKRLARILGANDNQATECVRLDLVLVSQIRGLLNSTP